MAVVYYSRHLIYITFVMHMICSTFSFTPSMTTISKQTHLTSTKESIFDQQVDDMFTKYDKDGNGYIDKEEFRAVAEKMKSSSRRREVFRYCNFR